MRGGGSRGAGAERIFGSGTWLPHQPNLSQVVGVVVVHQVADAMGNGIAGKASIRSPAFSIDFRSRLMLRRWLALKMER